uniref:peptidylamidoglycolate lyase n=1 Tax=Syphacia muris TaxID=451379 RepID=A0A0N5ANU7_9BILA
MAILQYENVKLPKFIGQVVGIALNSEGKLVILHRADRIWNADSFNDNNIFNSSLGPIKRSTLLILEPYTGKIIKEGGENLLYMPHGLFVDHKNNIWVTDVGSHQVFKLDSNMKVLLTLGEKLVPGSSSNHFCMPTDVAVTKAGAIFVSDGYCNSRILKFDSSGRFIKSFGQSYGIYKVPMEDTLTLPHSLTIDEQLSMICVADREEQRILCYSINDTDGQFDTSGELLTKIEDVGRVYAIRFKVEEQRVASGNELDKTICLKTAVKIAVP